MSAPQGYEVDIGILGDIVVQRRLEGIEHRALDWRPAWPDVVKAFQAIMQSAFSTEGGSTADGSWAPLAASTQKQRVRQGYPAAHPILARTHNLERALTVGQGAYVRSEPQRMQYVLSESVSYFIYHQSPRPRHRLPRRAPVSLKTSDVQALVNPIRLYIMGRGPHPDRPLPDELG